MKRDWFELARFDVTTLEPNEAVKRVAKVMATTLFVFFAPLVVVANLWVFYALYEGIGLVITVSLSTVLFAGIFGYIDTQWSTKPHSKPSTLAWLYLGSSLVLNVIVWALV